MSDRVTLRSETGPEGSRFLHARLDADGSIVLEGHDLGRGVEAFWGRGHSEYEWTHTIPSSELKKVREALGGAPGCDVLRLIAGWCAEHGEARLEPTLKEHGIRIEKWSWIGTDWD